MTMRQIMNRENIDNNSDGKVGLNLNYFLKLDGKKDVISAPVIDTKEKADVSDLSTEKKKRGRKKKEKIEYIEPDKPQEESNLPLYQSNQPYLSSYQDTNSMFRQSIDQIDILHSQIASDIGQIRNNKSIRNKYNIVSNLVSADCALMSTKISAVKEIAKAVTDSHNLDMKRIKELNNSVNDQDDDKRIQDLYNAYVNMPVEQMNPNSSFMMMPNSQEIAVANMAQPMQSELAGSQMNPNYQQMSPEMNLMINEGNPYVKQVVILDESLPIGYNMKFEFIDTRTGESVPGMIPKDKMFLPNLKIDKAIGVARDTQLNENYDLIVINGQGPSGIY